MKKCKDIQNNLPLYLDDSLSAADKKAVEEHLKICPQCTKTLSQLSKTETLVNSLHPVDPPPRFKQEIMAKVREEAEKKNLIQKLFYPLQIKIPVQIFATVCIAVVAVYIYRAGEEQMKEAVPSSAPAPVVEFQKSQLPEQKMRTSTDTEDIQQEDQLKQTSVMQKESVPALLPDTAGDVKQREAKGIKADKHESAPAVESAASPAPAVDKGNEQHVMDAAVKTSGVLKAKGHLIKSNIFLKVRDMDIAVEETEKLLAKYEAKNITSHMKQDKNVITAQLKSLKMKDFLTQLEKIGNIEENILPVADAEENVFIVVEFSK
ncbi:MAG: DUF2275 domain-containing protein [Syntrophaceae bacterium]|nr:DUF2275 domain-containing protein [Syntrophaceae bacterium]